MPWAAGHDCDDIQFGPEGHVIPGLDAGSSKLVVALNRTGMFIRGLNGAGIGRARIPMAIRA